MAKNDVSLYSIRNRTFKESQKNHVDFNYYVDIPYDTTVTIDNREVIGYAWVPLSDITNKSVKKFEKSFSALYADLIIQEDFVGKITLLTNTHNLMKIKNGLPYHASR